MLFYSRKLELYKLMSTSYLSFVLIYIYIYIYSNITQIYVMYILLEHIKININITVKWLNMFE